MNVTAEQEDAVEGAFKVLLSKDPTVEEPMAGGTATGIPEADQIAAEAAVADAETTETEPRKEATATDDVASLTTRLAERDAEVARYQERLLAVNDRNRQSLDTLNQRALRKATQIDRARQVLEKALSAEGVDKTEAERLLAEIRSGYNPGSANYAPPPVAEQPIAAAETDERAVDGNQWLNERGLTQAESDSLGTYIRNAQLTPREQRLAAQDIYSFLSLVEPRWRAAAATEPKTDAAKAVATVARVQKQAAKAASASLGAASTTVGQPSTRQKSAQLSDEQVGALIRQQMRGD
jgi:hypothetical protein